MTKHIHLAKGFAKAVLEQSGRALSPGEIIDEGIARGLHRLLGGYGVDEDILIAVLRSGAGKDFAYVGGKYQLASADKHDVEVRVEKVEDDAERKLSEGKVDLREHIDIKKDDGRTSRVCKLVDAHRQLPFGARLLSLRMKGKADVVVRSADDVLVWICKRVCLLHSSRLPSVMRLKRVGWLKATQSGMQNPYKIAYNCFLDLDGVGNTPLLRATKLIEWLDMPRGDIELVYWVQASEPMLGDDADVEQENAESRHSHNLKLLPYAMQVVMSRLVDAWKNGEPNAKRALLEAQSFSWCYDTFSITHSLLRVMQVGQSVPVGYRLLDNTRYPRVLILTDWTGVDCEAVIRWCGKYGVSEVEWRYLAEQESKRSESVSPVDDTKGATAVSIKRDVSASGSSSGLAPKTSLVQKLWAVISRDYPNGIVLNNSTIALLERSLDEKLTDAVVSLVKSMMFERADGILLYREMIVDDSALDRLISRAREYIDSEGFFSLDALLAEFDGAIRNLPDEGDFKKFFNDYVAEKIGGKIRGTKGRRMCFKMSGSDEECWRIMADSVRNKLLEAGDARSLDDLLTELPHLNREVVEHVAESAIEDAVVFDIDETKFVKLLEAYYLPKDFAEVLKAFIAETESQSAIVSITLLDEFLNSNYGDGFRVSYGLEDDSVYKQIISKSVRDGRHEWTRDMFIDRLKKSSSNVIEQFLQQHTGVFHEEEFFRFAEETRGMTNRGMLILTFLRKYCVRLSKEWWISENEFESHADLSVEALDSIAQTASEALGSAPFKPVSLLPQSFFDSLPTFMLAGREQHWNRYLFVSVAIRKINRVAIVNDDPSPYSVTAMIIPADQRGLKDVVAYVVSAASGYHFADAEAMFGYLKENSVRLFKTDKLIEKIDQLMKA